MRREKVHALILSRKNIGEADRLLMLFTKDYGLLRVIAKGVRKIPSRRGGHIEPLTHIIAIISAHANYHYLAAAETVNTYPELRTDTHTLIRAQDLAHVLLQLFEEDDAQPSLFDAMHEAYRLLPQLSSPKQHTLEVAVLLHALHCAGYLPDLNECLECGRAQPADAVVLDSRHGGWRCLSCHTSFRNTKVSLSPALLKAARFIARYPERALQLRLSAEQSGQINAAVRHYVNGMTDKPVFSLPFAQKHNYAR